MSIEAPEADVIDEVCEEVVYSCFLVVEHLHFDVVRQMQGVADPRVGVLFEDDYPDVVPMPVRRDRAPRLGVCDH